MRIGFIATRLAGVDGVSLETAKWVTILERMGHETFYCAGELDDDGPPSKLVPEMHFQHPMTLDVQRRAFSGTDILPDLDDDIRRKAQGLKIHVEAFIDDFDLDLIVVQNALTIPMHIPLGVALAEVIEATGIPTIAHHHDFYWERERFLVNRVPSFLRRAFPPVLPSMRHVVISTVMQRELEARTDIKAVYIPNVFDFENPPLPPDDYSMSFRASIGLGPDDVIFLQPTRLIARKSMERAINLVRMLNDPRYKYVVTGTDSDEPGPYFEWLFDEAIRAGVETYFIGDQIAMARGTTVDGEKLFTLWDVYPHADLVTYPSHYEGFGNALIETLYFKRPLLANTYPAYRSDIKPAGVRAIEINEVVTPGTAVEVLELLADKGRVQEMVEHNYAVGLKHFSYAVLERKLAQILDDFAASGLL